MSPIPRFAIRPTFRCFHFRGRAGATPCGRPAIAFRPAAVGQLSAFVCARHSRAEDLPIADDGEAPRVRLHINADLVGISWQPYVASREAVELIRGALIDVGALPNILDVSVVKAVFGAIPGDQGPNGDKS